MVKATKSTKEQFEKDLATGQKFEKRVLELIREKQPQAPYEVTVGKAYWDFSVADMKYEVKCDARASESGNLAFEWECYEKPSGISRWEPDIWVHGVGEQGCDGIYMGSMQEVRAGVIKAFYEGKARYMKFLGNGCSGFLMKVEDCQGFLERIDKKK